ncbi:MAG: phospho-N-acetylmuramoyl-pentapeptide-transferase [Fuerstiella sp.]|nr:phospho-N-acetylmuramoyl-pentapeptide-transferase [Fuerstiella sp.]
MFLWFVQSFSSLLEELESRTTGDSHVYLTARTAAASFSAFLLALVLGPIAIRLLKARFRERVHSDSERLNELQADKNNTPTMGGLFVMAAVLLSSLIWADLSSRYVLTGIFVLVSLTGLGALDDWIKLVTTRKGLTVRQKLSGQLFVASVAVVLIWLEQRHQTFGTSLVWPLGNAAIALGPWFIGWGILVLVGTSNAVNLTDGLDGLATGCTIFAGSAFVALTYLCGHRVMADYLMIPYISGAGELTIILGAMVGAMLGFLWFNCYPAQVFMGDAGSLPIGGLLALSALIIRQEALLVIVGGIFVLETLSVIFQVAWFHLTGRRLILCSPLHNHFLFRGDHEIKIVTRFWIGSALLAIVGIASLKLH